METPELGRTNGVFIVLGRLMPLWGAQQEFRSSVEYSKARRILVELD